MPVQVHNGTAVVAYTEQVHNGTALVAATEQVHNGTALVAVGNGGATTDGPVPVVAATTTGANTTQTVATLDIVMPTGLAAGDVLVMPVNVRASNVTCTAPDWTTHTRATVTGTQTLQYLSRVLDAAAASALSGATVTITQDVAGRSVARAVRITGARAVDVLDAGAGAGTTSSVTIGPVTTGGANRLLIAAWAVNDATITITEDAAMVEVGAQFSANTVQAMVVARQDIPTAGGTGTRVGTFSAATTGSGQMLAVAPVLV